MSTKTTALLFAGIGVACGGPVETAVQTQAVTTDCVGDLDTVDVGFVWADETAPDEIERHAEALPHAFAAPAATPRNQLFVFIPGTDPGYLQNMQTPGGPEHYQDLLRTAALSGYHAVGVDYLNELPVNVECSGTRPEVRCRERVRTEVLFGVDTWPRPSVRVDRANSFENRLLRLLQHLGWQQFYVGERVRWSRIVVAGHSQGGGHAAFLARRYAVQRAILFASTEASAWTDRSDPNNPFATEADRFWGFSSELDAVYPRNTDSWANLEIPGPVTPVDDLAPPTNGSQQLSTTLDAADDNHHGTVVLDVSTPRTDGRPDFVEVWCALIGATPGDIAL